jgi:CheY-like chemotaxis protein
MVSTPRVLVVDDDPEFLELVEARLARDERFDVFAEGSASDAMATLESRPFDCVVTDSLVLDTGKPLVRAVREQDPEVPLIYHTGKEWNDVAESALAANVSDYVQKEAGSLAKVARRIDVLVEKDAAEAVAPAGAVTEDAHERFSVAPLDVTGGSWDVVGVFDPQADVELDVLVAESVAEYLDRSLDSFTLYDGIDTDALERLVLPRSDGVVRRAVSVRFPVAGHLVAVTSAGEIAVRNRPLRE